MRRQGRFTSRYLSLLVSPHLACRERAGHARVEAEGGKGKAKPGVASDNAQVAGHGQAEAGANGVAVGKGQESRVRCYSTTDGSGATILVLLKNTLVFLHPVSPSSCDG